MAQELSSTVASIERAGGTVEWRPGQFAFSPAKGEPGLVLLDRDASISAVRHEAGHFFDDLNLGSPGLGHYLQNPEVRWTSEFSSYTQEIRFARQLGDRSAAWQLLRDAREERMLLLGR